MNGSHRGNSSDHAPTTIPPDLRSGAIHGRIGESSGPALRASSQKAHGTNLSSEEAKSNAASSNQLRHTKSSFIGKGTSMLGKNGTPS